MMLLETYKAIKELLKGGVSSKSFDFKGDKGTYTVKFIEKDGKMNYAIVISGSIIKKSETFTSKTKMLEEDLFSIISNYGFKSKDGEKPIIKDFSQVGKMNFDFVNDDDEEFNDDKDLYNFSKVESSVKNITSKIRKAYKDDSSIFDMEFDDFENDLKKYYFFCSKQIDENDEMYRVYIKKGNDLIYLMDFLT